MSNKKFPKVAHHSWKKCDAFEDSVMENLQSELQKRFPFKPSPNDIFKEFQMPVDMISMVLVGKQYPLYSVEKPHPPVQQRIWEILEKHEDWDDADNYAAPDMSDLPRCLVVALNRTTAENVWNEFNRRLFLFFKNDSVKRLFVCMDKESYEQCKILEESKHDVFKGFDPVEIRKWFRANHNENIYFGLPF